jgi:hypothetical protein
LLKRGLALAALCLVLPSPAGADPAAEAAVARLDVPRELRAVSYYPADAGWTQMWEPWRPARIAADLRRLRSLNANTVRVVVPAQYFGYPKPERQKLRLLHELVDIAAGARLHVHLTLFDWWEEYRDIEGSKRWARAVLAPYVGDRRIAFVELKNELDTTDRAALEWTRELVPWLRSLLKRQTPVTVSVGGTTPARRLRPLAAALPEPARPDFFTAHYFTAGGEAAEHVFATLRNLAAPTPLWIGELGYPTSTAQTGFEGVPLTASGQEAAQEHYFKLCFGALARLGLPAPGLWILDDFAAGAIPASDVREKETEYRFGLFREDGSAKPAARTVRRLFDGRLDTAFNGGFEAAAAAEDGSSVPAVWGSRGELRLVRDPAVARSGAASARVVGQPGRSGIFLVTPVAAAVRAGRARLSVWVRGADATIRVAIAWFGPAGRQVGLKWASVPAGGSWRRAVVEARPPAGAAFARIFLEARQLQGSAWIDDVSFSWR